MVESLVRLAAVLGRDRRFIAATIAAGIVLRLAQYFANPSLWLDEAMLALNLVSRSAAELRETLDYEQAAPLLFLLLERKLLDVLGTSDFSLRALPLVAGCAVVPLGAAAARRLLPPAGFAAALLLLAVSDPLIDYSVQVKPYALDAVVAAFALVLVLRLRQGDGGRRDALLLGILAFLAPWLSFSSAFVLPVFFAVLLASREVRSVTHLRLAVLGAAVTWAASTLGSGLFIMRGAEVGALQGVWGRTGGFAPLPPRTHYELLWYPFTAARVMRMPGGIYLPGLGVLLALSGAAHLFLRRRRGDVALLALPLLGALAASSLRVYPFFGRLLLFAAPSLIVLVSAGLVASGLGTVRARAGGRAPVDAPMVGRRAAAVLLPAVLVASVGFECARALYHVARPRVRGEMRSMTRLLEEEARPGDVVYVYYAAAPSFDYYLPAPGFDVVYGNRYRGDSDRYRPELDALSGTPRLWIVLSHIYRRGEVDEKALILGYLDARGRRVEAHPRTDGGLYLYDLSGASPRDPPEAGTDP